MIRHLARSGTPFTAVVATTLTAAALLLGSCADATEVELLEISGTGVLAGRAFLDLNGNGTLDGLDTPVEGATIVVTHPGSGAVVDQTQTDTLGLFVLPDLPLGSYRVGLAAAVLGDSLTVVGASSGSVSIQLQDTTVATLGVSFPVLTLEQVRTAAPGRRVFTTGIALNPRQSFSDGEIYLKGSTSFLRATYVERVTLGIGDSVRVLGRTGSDNGQPVLTDGTAFVLIPTAQVPVPRAATTGAAASASSGGAGTLDAALVRIQQAEITDTATVGSDFHFWVDDGSGPLEVVLRSFLGIDASPIRPDTIVRIQQATGLLKPFDDGAGNVRWRLLPRGGSEVAVETRRADVSVVARFDTAQASIGDTVEITVAVANAGPLTATGVEAADTLPAGFAYLGSSATQGAYDPATRIWQLASLAAGARDTLRIQATVTTSALGDRANVARIGGLDREVDPNTVDNTSVATISLVAPPVTPAPARSSSLPVPWRGRAP